MTLNTLIQEGRKLLEIRRHRKWVTMDLKFKSAADLKKAAGLVTSIAKGRKKGLSVSLSLSSTDQGSDIADDLSKAGVQFTHHIDWEDYD